MLVEAVVTARRRGDTAKLRIAVDVDWRSTKEFANCATPHGVTGVATLSEGILSIVFVGLVILVIQSHCCPVWVSNWVPPDSCDASRRNQCVGPQIQVLHTVPGDRLSHAGAHKSSFQGVRTSYSVDRYNLSDFLVIAVATYSVQGGCDTDEHPWCRATPLSWQATLGNRAGWIIGRRARVGLVGVIL